MSDKQVEKVPTKQNTKKKEKFSSGLFSLMTKQCIFSALLFGIVYFLKNINLPISTPICLAIKNAVVFDMSFEYVKNIFIGLFL